MRPERILLAGLLLLGQTGAQALELRDDLDRRVQLDKPAQRIVALAPHLVENLYAVGAGERIVATVSWSDYPPEARRIPRLGSDQALSVEAILAFKPDLVLLWASGNGRDLLERLQALGLTVYASEPRSLQSIGDSLRALGQLTGRAEQAEVRAAQLDAAFARLRTRYATRTAVPVFYQIWHAPLQTVNGEHLISAVVDLCGGRNVFASATALAPRLSIESVVAANPAVIVSGQSVAEMAAFWDRWQSIDAVRLQQLYRIDPDWMHRHSPRMVQGAEALCSALDQAREITARPSP